MGIDIVAARFVSAIINPSRGRSVCVERGPCDQHAVGKSRLCRAWSEAAGRKWRWTVACVNSIADVAEIFSQAMADQDFARLDINQRTIHFTSGAADEDN